MSEMGRSKGRSKGRSCGTYAQVLGLLVTGSVTTVLAKTAYQTQSYGVDDKHLEYFVKPWCMTFIQFVSMAGCLLLHACLYGCKTTKDEKSGREKRRPRKFTLKQLGYLLLPTFFAASGLSLMNAALVYVNAEVLEMLKVCLRVVTAALLSRLFLKRMFNKLHIWGMLVLIVGGTVVAVDTALQHRDDLANGEEKQVIGVAMIVAASVLQGSQLVAEEFYLRKYPVHPLQLLGYEGIIACVVALPLLVALQFAKGSDAGSVESTWNSALMILHSTRLQIILPAYVTGHMTYLAFGITLTASTGAAFRSIVVSMKSLCVWSLEVSLFYCTRGGFGEKIDWIYSTVEGAGYLIVSGGIFLYTKGEGYLPPAGGREEGGREEYSRLLDVDDDDERGLMFNRVDSFAILQ